jgi:hypothetical protein
MRLSDRFNWFLFTFFVLCGVSGCSGQGESALTQDEGSVIDAATTEIGTSMGNPVLPKTSVTFVASTGGEASTRALSASADNCTPYTEDGAQSQKCLVTPQRYGLGILAMSLVECVDADGIAVLCSSSDVTGISRRRTLYDGEQIDLDLTTEASAFSGTLNDVEAGIEVGGLQIVTAYIEMGFPDAEASPSEAAKLAESVQGVDARICTTPHDGVSTETMAGRCGSSEARMGDFLVDQDGSGTLGFIDFWSHSAVDTATRPELYETFIGDNVFNTGTARFLNAVLDPNPEITSSDFYAVAGYFAPILPLTTLVSYENSGEYALHVTFDISDTSAFIDGNASLIFGDPVCVAALEGSACVADGSEPAEFGVYDPADGDSDPSSVGVFNPYYDGGFLPLLPSATISVE